MISLPTSPLDSTPVKDNTETPKPKADFVRPVLANVSQEKMGTNDETRQGLSRVIGKIIEHRSQSKKRKAILNYQKLNSPPLGLGHKFKKAA